jgi:hypothetical protein
MIWKILIEDTRTGGIVVISSTGNNEEEAERNICKRYPKAKKSDYKVLAMLTEQSFNRLMGLGLIR